MLKWSGSLLNWHKAEITLIFWKRHWHHAENNLFGDHSADIFPRLYLFFEEENKLLVAEELIFSCCCFFHWSHHHHPPFVTSELLASEIIMISQTEDYDLQMRKAQRGGQIPQQQPSEYLWNICEIFVKMSLQLKKKKKKEGERAGGKHPKNIISRMSCQPAFFSPSFPFGAHDSLTCLI